MGLTTVLALSEPLPAFRMLRELAPVPDPPCVVNPGHWSHNRGEAPISMTHPISFQYAIGIRNRNTHGRAPRPATRARAHVAHGGARRRTRDHRAENICKKLVENNVEK